MTRQQRLHQNIKKLHRHTKSVIDVIGRKPGRVFNAIFADDKKICINVGEIVEKTKADIMKMRLHVTAEGQPFEEFNEMLALEVSTNVGIYLEDQLLSEEKRIQSMV